MEKQILSILFGLTSYFVSFYLLRSRKKDTQYSALNCVLPPFGYVTFVQVEDNLCRIECHLSLKGVTPGLHGLHAHEFGDLTERM